MSKNKELISEIVEFVKSGKGTLALPMMPIQDIIIILEAIGFDKFDMSGGETNGWQVDFWYEFHHPEKGDYTLEGSLHYGDFELIKSEES